MMMMMMMVTVRIQTHELVKKTAQWDECVAVSLFQYTLWINKAWDHYQLSSASRIIHSIKKIVLKRITVVRGSDLTSQNRSKSILCSWQRHFIIKNSLPVPHPCPYTSFHLRDGYIILNNLHLFTVFLMCHVCATVNYYCG